MFYHIAGDYVYREENFAVVDCGGVGYRLTVSGNTSDALGNPLPDGGKRVKLYTYLAVREDGVELFGFYTEEELAAFRLLISVSGVGPKAALSILSMMTPDGLAAAVCNEDARAIARANGIGPKTAARVVLELHDKFGGFAPSRPISAPSAAYNAAPSGGRTAEATEALATLGYSRPQIAEAMRHIDVSSLSVEDIITSALKYFSK